MPTKKNLGRGLDDLLSQHDTDLPFLSSYGTDEKLPLEEGLPPSTSSTNIAELMGALKRLIIQEGAIFSKQTEKESHVNDYLKLKLMKEGVSISVKSKNSILPLVPTDLQQPGMIRGKISSNKQECKVVIVDWGVPCRRLIERLIEYWKLSVS